MIQTEETSIKKPIGFNSMIREVNYAITLQCLPIQSIFILEIILKRIKDISFNLLQVQVSANNVLL